MNSQTLTRAALTLSLILLCNIHTHAQEWKWAQSFAGSTAGFGTGGGSENYILRSHLDNEGNVYIFAKFGASAYYNNVSGALDPERRSVDGWKNGVMVAKIGANGEFIWKKVVRTNRMSTGYGISNIHWAEFKEDAIYVMLNVNCNLAYETNKLHFFGEEKDMTEVEAINTPPFKMGEWTALVKLSYDGEVLDKHFIQLIHRTHYDINHRTYLSPVLSLFHVDNSGNTYILLISTLIMV